MDMRNRFTLYEVTAELHQLGNRLKAREFDLDPGLATDLGSVLVRLGDVLGDIATDDAGGVG